MRIVTSERGLTLTELTIVTVLASIVMLGLVGFYMNSQALWMDASAQAITQREASSLVEAISRHARSAHHAQASPSGDQIEFFDEGGNPTWAYWWKNCSGCDSLIHAGPDPGSDRGAVVTSNVEAFQLVKGDSLVEITLLRLRSAQGERVQLSTRVALQNRTPSP